MKITILGSGGWGCAMGIHLAKLNYDIMLWTSRENEMETLKKDREHKALLPGIALPNNIDFTTDDSSVKSADIVIFAVPSFLIRQTAKRVAPFINKNTIILNISKGFEKATQKRLSQVLEEEIPDNPIAIMSGPSHAEEVARGVPTTVVVSSKDIDLSEYVQDVLMSPSLRVYTSMDMAGIELGGALKNVIALAAGISDGMGYGDNTKAALMTRGMEEIARLGVTMGAKVETFTGLTGMGDLIVTCTSMLSRNRRAGILIGKGMSPEDAVHEVGTVEGYDAAGAAFELAKKYQVDMPIVNEIYAVLFEKKDTKEAIYHLMTRQKKHEHEVNWKL